MVLLIMHVNVRLFVNKLKCFSTVCHFQLSLMFAKKARTYLGGASCNACKYYSKVEVFVSVLCQILLKKLITTEKVLKDCFKIIKNE